MDRVNKSAPMEDPLRPVRDPNLPVKKIIVVGKGHNNKSAANDGTAPPHSEVGAYCYI